MTDLMSRLSAMSPEQRDYICAALCVHLLEAGELDRAEQILGELPFIAVRCTTGRLNELLGDYDATRRALASTWNDDSRIAQFARFVSQSAYLLRTSPDVIYQEAFNADEESVHEAATGLRDAGDFPRQQWLRRTSAAGRARHRGGVISMAWWGSDQRLVVSTDAREVWIWDLTRQRLWRRCDTPPSAAKSLAVSPNGAFLAAGFGAADPTPLIAGVHVWRLDGSIHRTYTLSDWAYAVRWRDDDELIVGAGMPSGSEAQGTLWRLRVSSGTRDEIGYALADRPIVFTWDPRPDEPGHIMALSLDGFVCHVTPDYVPLTRDQVMNVETQVWKDRSYAARDAKMAELRPIVTRICAPCVGTYGFHEAMCVSGPNEIAVLGEPPVPPEFLIFHDSNADGLYRIDFDAENSTKFPFPQQAREAGFRAICLAAAPDGIVALGANNGEVVAFPRPDPTTSSGMISSIHRGRSPVTALAYSASGNLVAIGDAAGQVTVYDTHDRRVVFTTDRAEPAIAAAVGAPSSALVLFADRLERIPTDGSAEREIVALPKDVTPLDFSHVNGRAFVLCAKATSKKSREQDAREIAIVDMRAKRLEKRVPIPSSLGNKSSTPAASRKLRRDFDRIRVHTDDVVVLGSPEGLMENGVALTLPAEELKRERFISVTRMGSELPEIACSLFSIVPGSRAVVCAYADNAAHPNISGELRVWDLSTARFSKMQPLTSAVTALAAASTDLIVAGTEHGEVTSWRYVDGWERLATRMHPVQVVALACDSDSGLVCSVSRDGLLFVWNGRDGSIILRASVDDEPVAVGFVDERRSLCVVGRGGDLHTWVIES